MTTKPLPVMAACGLLLAAGDAARAASLTIWNNSFETPVQTDGSFTQASVAAQGTYGWTMPANSEGIWNPQSSSFNNAAGNGTPQGGDGSQLLYLFNTSGIAAAVTQQLAGTDGIVGNGDDPVLVAGSLYTFTIAVGQRNSAPAWGGYDIKLLAGSTTVLEEADQFVPTPGTLADRTIQFNSNLVSPSLYGQPLTISLQGTIGNGTVEFDNARISVVPEPGSLALLGWCGASLGVARLRRKHAH